MVQGHFFLNRSNLTSCSDGDDNRSSFNPSVIAQQLCSKDIVLDSIVIGTDETDDLFKISTHTGGYAFSPKTKQALFQIFLLETMVDIRTRPDIAKVKFKKWETFVPKSPDMSSLYDFPPCRPHKNQGDEFCLLDAAEKDIRKLEPDSDRSISAKHNSGAGPGRGLARGLPSLLLSEIKAIRENPHENMDVYVSQTNMSFWKVVCCLRILYITLADCKDRSCRVLRMLPTHEERFSCGLKSVRTFHGVHQLRGLSRQFSNLISPRYVISKLSGFFPTNCFQHGRICHPIFSRAWSPTTRIYEVLQHCYDILMSFEVR